MGVTFTKTHIKKPFTSHIDIYKAATKTRGASIQLRLYGNVGATIQNSIASSWEPNSLLGLLVKKMKSMY